MKFPRLGSFTISYSWLVVSVITSVCIVLWYVWIIPSITRLPDTLEYDLSIASVDRFYDSSIQSFTQESFSKTQFTLKPIIVTNKAIQFEHIFDVKTPDNTSIFSVKRVYGIDRTTYQHIESFADKKREGYLFAPRNLRKGESFTYWHINYDAPAEMQYQNEESLYGLTTYRYTSNYIGQTVDQTQDLTNLPEVGETRGVRLYPNLEVWIEPTTGMMVKYKDTTKAYYYNLSTGADIEPWNYFSNEVQDTSIEKLANELSRIKILYTIVDTGIPLILLLLLLYSLTSSYHFLARKYINPILNLTLIACNTGVFIFLLYLTVQGDVSQTRSILTIIVMGLILLTGIIITYYSAKKQVILSLSIAYILLIMFILIRNILSPSEIYDTSYVILFSLILLLLFLGLIAQTIVSKYTVYLSSFFSVLSIIIIVWFLGIQLVYSSINTLLFTPPQLGLLIGVLIFSLQCLRITLDNRALNLPILIGQTQLTIVLLSLTFVLSTYFIINTQEQQRDDFRGENNAILDTIRERITIYSNALQSGAGFLAASDGVSRLEWRTYVNSLNLPGNYPGMQGYGYSVFVRPEDIFAHTQGVRQEGFPNYMIWPPGERDIYSSIIYLEPFDARNQRAFGYDMFSEPVRRRAMVQAMETGQPQISGKVTLIQEIEGQDIQSGFLVYVPYYGSQGIPQTLEERKSSIKGYVYSPFRMGDFINTSISPDPDSSVKISIYDGTIISEETKVYQSKQSGIYNGRKYTKVMYFLGRPWTFVFEDNNIIDFQDNMIPIISLFIGTVLSVLLSTIFYVLSISKSKTLEYTQKLKQLNEGLEETVDERTSELKHSKQELEIRAQEAEKFNTLTVDRELKMIELKNTIKELKKEVRTLKEKV